MEKGVLTSSQRLLLNIVAGVLFLLLFISILITCESVSMDLFTPPLVCCLLPHAFKHLFSCTHYFHLFNNLMKMFVASAMTLSGQMFVQGSRSAWLILLTFVLEKWKCTGKAFVASLVFHCHSSKNNPSPYPVTH